MKNKPRNRAFWKQGEQSAIAKLLGVGLSTVNDIIHRRCGVSYERARILELVSAAVLDEKVSWHVWISNKDSKHKAFYGKPKKLKTKRR